MTEERTGPVPPPGALDELQAAIQQELDAGSPGSAAARLAELPAPDQAELMAGLDADGQHALLRALPSDTVADIIEHLDVDDAAELSGLIEADRLAAVLDLTPPEVAVDILRQIEWVDASQALSQMADRRTVGALLLYPDDDAGGLMTPEVTGLREDLPVSMALSMLRRSEIPRDRLRQLFAIDGNGVLTGALELPDLVFTPPNARVRDVMSPNPVAVEAGTDQEECARLMDRYEVRSLPVTDAEGRLIGAIAVEDLVDVVQDEATEDMFRMVGIGGEEHALEPLWASVQSRLPWLALNLATVLLAGFMLSLFDETLSKAAIIAVFIPVVLGQAGIAGSQTLTMIVRSLGLGDIHGGDATRLLRHELTLAAIQGVTLAALLGVTVWLWQADLYLGLVVSGAVLVNVLIAAAGGVLVPLAMRLIRIDPAVASAVLVTTLTDVFGLVVYLSLATAFLTLFRV